MKKEIIILSSVVIALTTCTFTSRIVSAQSWNALGATGTNNAVQAVVLGGGNLYVGGNFTSAGGVAANKIAKWNGSVWSALGSGMNGTVYSLAWDGSNLYAGGDFTTAGGITVNYVAKWNGSAWSTLGSGMDNIRVSALCWDGSNLFAGGSFSVAGGVPVNYIAKWDGSVWSAVGTGTDGIVYSLTSDGTNLYAGGNFFNAGGTTVNSIAKWDGSVWSALGTGTGSNLAVYALAWYGSNLCAGGIFTTMGGTTVNYIAQWNGSAWSAFGSGMNNTVYGVGSNGSNLYAGGLFTTADGVSANRIAQWNGSTWIALGSGMNGGVSALAVNGSCLYAGGAFTTSGGVTTNRVATWGAASCVTTLPIELLSFSGVCEMAQIKLHWQTASETNNDYFTIEQGVDGINFESIGILHGGGNSSAVLDYEFNAPPLLIGEGWGEPLYYRLRQTDYDGKYEYFGPISVSCSTSDHWSVILQNTPVQDELLGTLFIAEDAQVQIEILDLQGRKVISNQLLANKGSNLLQLDVKNISDGIYFLIVTNGIFSVTKKLSKQ